MTPFILVASWSENAVGRVDHLLDAIGPSCPDGRASVVAPGAAATAGLSKVLATDAATDGVSIDHERRWLLAGNVRLYDRADVVERLGSGEDESDLQLLGRAYARFGPEFLTEVIGDFAFVVWDWAERKLHAIRDHFGIRPLYFLPLQNGIAMASDPRQLLLLKPEVRGDVDPEMVLDYLLTDYRHHGLTFFRSIKQVWPANHLVATETSIEQRRFWVPPVGNTFKGTPAEALDEWRSLFRKAVDDRLRSDRPIAAYLSGGLDSGSIAGVAHELKAAKSHHYPSFLTLSATFPGLTCDETPYIDILQKAFPLFEAFRWNGAETNSGDLDNPSVVKPGLREGIGRGPRQEIEAVRRFGARVLLMGVNGDELGWSHGIFRDLVAGGHFILLAKQLAQLGRLRVAWVHFRAGMLGVGRRKRPRQAPDWLGAKLADFFPGSPDDDTLDGFLFRSHVEQQAWKVLTLPQTSVIIDNCSLVGADAACEVRLPYCDIRLVNFVCTLTWQNRLPDGDMRRLQRGAVTPFLPPEVRERVTKSEFSGPLGRQMQIHLPRINALFRGRKWASEAFVSQSGARKVFSDLMAFDPFVRRPLAWRLVWKIAVFEVWMRALMR